MALIPAQFSEARAQQLDAQFNLFRAFTGKAFDSAEKLAALNLDTTRAALEKSSALMRQVAAAKDPRDLLALTGQTQSQFESVLSYARQLCGIAAGMAIVPGPVLAAPPAPAAEPVTMPEPALEFGEAPVAEPVAIAEPAPIAEPTPIAKAAGAPEGLPQPSAASFPVPTSSKPIAVSQVKPVEAQPPHAPVSGTPDIVTQRADAPAAKPPRKK